MLAIGTLLAGAATWLFFSAEALGNDWLAAAAMVALVVLVCLVALRVPARGLASDFFSLAPLGLAALSLLLTERLLPTGAFHHPALLLATLAFLPLVVGRRSAVLWVGWISLLSFALLTFMFEDIFPRQRINWSRGFIILEIGLAGCLLIAEGLIARGETWLDRRWARRFLAVLVGGFAMAATVRTLNNITIETPVVLIAAWSIPAGMALFYLRRRRSRPPRPVPRAPAVPPALLFISTALVAVTLLQPVFVRYQIATQGRSVLLPLAAPDGRWLLTDATFNLIYATPALPDPATVSGLYARGVAVFIPAPDGTAQFSHIARDDRIGPDEMRLRYRLVGPKAAPRIAYGAARVSARRWTSAEIAAAEYAMLRVAEDGSSLFTGLADEAGQRIGRAGSARTRVM